MKPKVPITQTATLESPQGIQQRERQMLEHSCAGNRDSSRLSRATQDFYSRLDNLIASSLTATNTHVDCKMGCDYCCYYKVSLSANELFLISAYMEKHFSAQQIDTVIAAARTNAALISQMTTAEHLSSNIKCPLLQEGSCTTYEVRPAMCRKHHSLDVTLCRTSFDNPADASIPNPEAPEVAGRAFAAITGAREGLARGGLDTGLYDLSHGLVEVFGDNKSEKRWKKGKRAFSKAASVL